MANANDFSSWLAGFGSRNLSGGRRSVELLEDLSAADHGVAWVEAVGFSGRQPMLICDCRLIFPLLSDKDFERSPCEARSAVCSQRLTQIAQAQFAPALQQPVPDTGLSPLENGMLGVLLMVNQGQFVGDTHGGHIRLSLLHYMLELCGFSRNDLSLDRLVQLGFLQVEFGFRNWGGGDPSNTFLLPGRALAAPRSR